MAVGTQVTIAPKRAPHRRYLPMRPDHETVPDLREPGLYPGEPETCRRSLRPFLVNFVQLGLLLAVFRVYHIEERAFQGRAFQSLISLALFALPLHYLTPFRYKKPLFVGLSMVGLFWVFGPWVSMAVLAVAVVFIGTCYLPIHWGLRASICAMAAALVVSTRSAIVPDFIPSSAVPIIASMFMFRLIIYLYELRHASKPEPLVDTLGYFFVLPNYCFMHFPVIDYRTMQRGYFTEDVHATQRRGLEMMCRGTIHLLCYRLVYHELLRPASQVHSFGELAMHLVCNYLLYLQVSGQFHMACGMLHLFGFRLPETHHHYLLATGFTDYWRRINIYWKDFMVRIFFNPVVFRLKRWPQPMALAAATTTVFLATWLLHAYQSFLLLGTWGFTAPDALFWGILGVLVLVNVQLDARAVGARRAAKARGGCEDVTPFSVLVRSMKVLGTFTMLSLLWSLWSSPSVSAWLDLLHRGFSGS
jgi:alginate O-acetyltransferase complex protein AlgI